MLCLLSPSSLCSSCGGSFLDRHCDSLVFLKFPFEHSFGDFLAFDTRGYHDIFILFSLHFYNFNLGVQPR